jgi:hypothetical protein
MTLKSIFNQSIRPETVFLVLSRDEFTKSGLPSVLGRYRKFGLEIIFDHGNARSYKKLLPVMRAAPEMDIVTADDDVLYPREWLAGLLRVRSAAAATVVGHRGTVITFTKGAVDDYRRWPRATPSTPNGRVFLTGMGGILYPSGLMPQAVLDLDRAMRLCPTADDIWFKAMELYGEVPVRKVSCAPGDFPANNARRDVPLSAHNVGLGANDVQFRAVMDHFDLWGRLGSYDEDA